jgi:ABC-2 type transport system permease protein
MAVIGSALATTLLYALTIAAIGDLDWGPVAGGYLGLLLCAVALASIGVMCSALSRNQIIAFILGLLICFALWLADKVVFVLPAALGPLLAQLSIDAHFANLARGVVDSRDVLYYLSLAAIAIFGAVRALARRHA